MDTEDKEMLTELLNTGKLTPYCEEAFAKWLETHQSRPISVAMRDWALREKAKLTGRPGERYEPTTEYDNCKLQFDQKGVFIVVANRKMGQVVTKKEGVTILAWLTGALEDLVRVPMIQSEREETKQEPTAFDKEYGFVEDNRETNESIDSSTGETVQEESFEIDEENPF